jgi:hypothetical protein
MKFLLNLASAGFGAGAPDQILEREKLLMFQ